ncbi:putative chitinase 10 [Tachypleus tridentatus]|uniref:putative chitinase 10 n=1 Tax=Tachypleus tridentatus TaxID=6853 RepID=UPI003FD3BAA7
MRTLKPITRMFLVGICVLVLETLPRRRNVLVESLSIAETDPPFDRNKYTLPDPPPTPDYPDPPSTSHRLGSLPPADNMDTQPSVIYPDLTTSNPTRKPSFFCFRNGLFQDPVDCSSFYQCFGLRAFRMDCPSGLYFNTKLQSCDWPQNVICHNPPSPVDSSKCSRDGLFADLEDCNRFYTCVSGRIYRHRCPIMLVFDQTFGVCDWKSKVRCPSKHSEIIKNSLTL